MPVDLNNLVNSIGWGQDFGLLASFVGWNQKYGHVANLIFMFHALLVLLSISCNFLLAALLLQHFPVNLDTLSEDHVASEG